MISLDENTTKEYCLTIIKKNWLNTPITFPDFLTEVSNQSKFQNEQCLQTIINDLKNQFALFPQFPLKRKKWRSQTLNKINDILNTESIIGIHLLMNTNEIAELQKELKKFLQTVRKFAPKLTFEGIGQATRNYVVYVMFKQINMIFSSYNTACFGYSMLYPFTDNYIDNESVSLKQKLAYNQMIRDKIKGLDVYPYTLYQYKTCKLLHAIELEYPRERDSTIFTLLQMILDSQEDSLRQQNNDILLTAEEPLNISLCKGGISVLIDQFFVKNNFTEYELNFYLSFGFFLQLVDDLQDIKEDYNKGYQTIFTQNLCPKETEKIVNKMLHFIHQIVISYNAPNKCFLNFLLSNCYQLVYLSVTGSKDFFSKSYLNKLEKFYFISYSFSETYVTNKMKNETLLISNKYMKILDELLLE
ncbi:MAG: hypothetical protein ACERKZ_17130 [Lachnotalea sp.]